MAGGFNFNSAKKILDEHLVQENANPVDFFYTLKLAPEIKDLRPYQFNYLNEWYKSFSDGLNNHLVNLDTGSGKTMVGLMMAESIRRKKRGKVLYLCPTQQLVIQTLEKAKMYGLTNAVSYLSSSDPEWQSRSKKQFLENSSFCITTYHALFNARSAFAQYDLAGIIFDDSHRAIELVDSCFTVRIKRGDNAAPYLWDKVFNTIQHTRSIKESASDFIGEKNQGITALIPPMEWLCVSDSIKAIIDSEVSANEKWSAVFSWANMRDVFDSAICIVTPRAIEISLLYPRWQNNNFLNEAVQRVFMSAATPSAQDLVRVFGIKSNPIKVDKFGYRPERLFILSSCLGIGEADKDSFSRAAITSINNKALVLVPNSDSCKPYIGMQGVTIPDGNLQIENAISRFRINADGLLVLKYRYDGVDFKDDECRLLVVDGFPFIGSLKIRFFAEKMGSGFNHVYRSMLTSMIAQAFGRTVRSPSDFSIIFVLSRRLNDWLLNADNESYLPSQIVQDLSIGKALSEIIDGREALLDLCHKMLAQSSEWKDILEGQKLLVADTEEIDPEELSKQIAMAMVERDIVDAIYLGANDRAKSIIEKNRDSLGAHSRPLLGLLFALMANGFKRGGRNTDADLAYETAYNLEPLLSHALGPITSSARAKKAVASRSAAPNMSRTMSSAKFEEGLKILGDLLGLDTERPEKTTKARIDKVGTTIDTLWVDTENKIVYAFEAKSGKTCESLNCIDVGQSLQHWNWLDENFGDYKKSLFIVGDFEYRSPQSQPGANMMTVPIDDVVELTGRIDQLQKYARWFPNELDSQMATLGLTDINTFFPNRRLVKDLPVSPVGVTEHPQPIQ